MCVVSMIMDHYWDRWQPFRPPPGVYPHPYYPGTIPPTEPIVSPQPPTQPQTIPIQIVPGVPAISPAEIEEFRKLLERAREYDKRNNEPDCELQEKKDRIKKLADELGVTIDFL